MLKKYCITLSLLIIFSINAQAAGSDPKPEKIRTKYIQAVELIKSAKKYEIKGKIDKA